MKTEPLRADSITAAMGNTIYPAPFAAVVEGRTKRKLGEQYGLDNFGVNLTTLEPGAASALMHHHSKQDEFIYILEGSPTLRLGDEEFVMRAGTCCGFKAGSGVPHQLVNRSAEPVSYLEIGDRTVGDQAEFPHDDLKASQTENGRWLLTRKNGEPY